MTDTPRRRADARGETLGAAFSEALVDADYTARDLLLDVRGVDAPAMLRTWGDVVDNAATLWHELPGGPGNSTLTRLAEMTRALTRTQTVSGWPRPGPPDDRLARLAVSFAHTTHQLRAAPPVIGSSEDNAAAGDVARMRLLHTLYVTAHAMGVAVREHVGDARRRPNGTARAVNLTVVGPAVLGRLTAFEQVAGANLGAKPETAPTQKATTGDQLREALVRWDIQAHRALATTPTAQTLVMITRVQASLAATSNALLRVGAATGHVDPDAYAHRLAPALDQGLRAWSRLAGRWAELTAPTLLAVDGDLTRAAGQLRAAMLDVAFDGTAIAAPDITNIRVNLAEVSRDVQQALSAAVDVAHIARDVAAGHPDLTGPARVMSRRASDDAEIRGPTISGVWVPLRDVHANRLVPIPAPARAGLVAASDDTVAAAHLAMSAAAVLDRPPSTAHSGRRPSERGAPRCANAEHSSRTIPAKGPAPSR